MIFIKAGAKDVKWISIGFVFLSVETASGCFKCENLTR